MTIVESIRLDAVYADGIIGLAPSPQRTGKTLFIDQLYKNNLIRDRVFSLKFKQGSGTQKKSQIIFGDLGLDSSLISWHSIVDPYFWSVKLISASVNNKDISITSRTAVLDSGSANIIMP